MIRELRREEYSLMVDLGKLLKDNFNETSISSNEKVFVYEDNDILGFIQILSLYETLEIINVVVESSNRGAGIGTKLLNYVIEKFNPEHVLLEVRETNESAINFYKKNGFIEIRKIKNYYGTEDGIVMERKLV